MKRYQARINEIDPDVYAPGVEAQIYHFHGLNGYVSGEQIKIEIAHAKGFESNRPGYLRELVTSSARYYRKVAESFEAQDEADD